MVQLLLYMMMRTVLPPCLYLVVGTKVHQLIMPFYMKCQMKTALSCSGQCNFRRQHNKRPVYHSSYSAKKSSTVATIMEQILFGLTDQMHKFSFPKCMIGIHCLHTVSENRSLKNCSRMQVCGLVLGCSYHMSF